MIPGSPDARSDEALMLAFATGDAPAFECLYARHRIWLHGMLMRQVGSTTAADDIFQETWMSLIRAATSYQPSARFSTWLYFLARQRLVDHWRRQDPEADPLDGDVPGDGDDAPLPEALIERREPADALLQRQRSALLERALRSLPPTQREALLLAEMRDMSLEEIAMLTGVPREAVKSRLRYARARLAAWLSRETA